MAALADRAMVLSTLRRDQGGLRRMLQRWPRDMCRGLQVDWTAPFAETGARRVRAAHLRLPAAALLAGHCGCADRPSGTGHERRHRPVHRRGHRHGRPYGPGHPDLTAHGPWPEHIATAPRPVAVLETVRSPRGRPRPSAPEEVDPGSPSRTWGWTPVMAVELRTRLGTATGLALPTSLAFDHPTPQALAGFLHRRLGGSRPPPPCPQSPPRRWLSPTSR